MSTGITDEFVKGLWRQNPVLVQALGMCPTLAVTNAAANGLAMGLATSFVLVGSGLLISLVRTLVPAAVRIPVYMLIIATFVTTVDYVLQALTPGIHAALGAFVYLIAVNCLILGRAEVFASKHTPAETLADATGMGVGFTTALLMIGSVREILGSGTWFEIVLMPDGFQPWAVMLLPAGGFFTLAGWVLIANRMRAPRPRARMRPGESRA